MLAVEQARVRRAGASYFADLTLALPRRYTFEHTGELVQRGHRGRASHAARGRRGHPHRAAPGPGGEHLRPGAGGGRAQQRERA